jgi:transcriptional regulator with XRE-family HTH domain
LSLARVFGISQAAVSYWFSGKNIPSPDTILALQKWADEATWIEYEKKNRGSVRPPPRRKARSKRIAYEETRKAGPCQS